MDREGQVLWYADGYHAGLFLRSHDVLVKSLWEILDGFDSRPQWRVNLEIEAFALEQLAQTDPDLVAALGRACSAGRLEIVSGSYTQPLPWVIDGESNIRNLKVGKEVTCGVLGGCEVVTYAVQEPCWSSQLPQLLSGLGFRWCVLKNHFAYFGRPPKHNEGKVYWVGPDGSRIVTSPSYSAFETTTFNDPGVRGGQEFLRRCTEDGVRDPIAFFNEDIAGAAPSYIDDTPACMRLTLYKDYFESTPPPETDWRIGLEDFKLALHWGLPALSALSRACHSLQADVLAAEEISSIASLAGGVRYPAEAIDQVWKTLMRLQHHDPWLVPESKLGMYAEQPFPWWVVKWSGECHSACSRLIDDGIASVASGLDRPTLSEDALTISGPGQLRIPVVKTLGPGASIECRQSTPGSGESRVVVVNTLGAGRRDVVTVQMPEGYDSRSLRIMDSDGRQVPQQREGDAIVFVADVPSFGYCTYRVAAEGDLAVSPRPHTAIITESDELVWVTTPFCELELDRRHGGCISRLYDKQAGRELIDSARGYGNDVAAVLGEDGEGNGVDRHTRVSDGPGRITVLANGPVHACIRIDAHLSEFAVATTLRLYSHTPRIDLAVEFDFGSGTSIGDSYRSARWTDKRQSWHVDRKKLQVQFPLDLPEAGLYKDAAFEVMESHLDDAFHESWDDVKTNTILNWVDVSNGQSGLCLFTDRTTSYGYSCDWPLSLILAWGKLEGRHGFGYSLLPHLGLWDEARLPFEASARDNSLRAAVCHVGGEAAAEQTSAVSLVQSEPSCVLLSSVFQEAGDWFVRVFNASDRATDARVVIPRRMGVSAQSAALTGAATGPLPIEERGEATGVGFRMRPFGIETIRIAPLPAR